MLLPSFPFGFPPGFIQVVCEALIYIIFVIIIYIIFIFALSAISDLVSCICGMGSDDDLGNKIQTKIYFYRLLELNTFKEEFVLYWNLNVC